MSVYDSSLNMVNANVRESKHGYVNRATANSMYKSYVNWFKTKYGKSERPLSFRDWMNWAKSTKFLSASGTTSSRTTARVAPPIVRSTTPSSSGGNPPPPVNKTTTPVSSGGGGGSSGGGGGGAEGPKPTEDNLKDLGTVNKTGRNIAIAILVISAIGIAMAFTGNKQEATKN